MRKIKEVLRLRCELKLGYQQIGRSCAIATSTVHKYLKRRFGPKGFSRGCRVLSSRSIYPRSYCIKLTSQMPSSTSWMPTRCPS